MTWRTQINDKGVVTHYSDADTGQSISAREYERRMVTQPGGYSSSSPTVGMQSTGAGRKATINERGILNSSDYGGRNPSSGTMLVPPPPAYEALPPATAADPFPNSSPTTMEGGSPLIQQGAQILTPGLESSSADNTVAPRADQDPDNGSSGMPVQTKNLRMEGLAQQHATSGSNQTYKPHGFLDTTSIAILLPTLVLLALIIAAAHKKRLFPWQTIRTFNPPSGLLSPREYERSFLCPPNGRRHGRMGKRNPNATWEEADGVVLPFGFMARTHLPITIPLGRLPNKNMFLVAPSGSGKTTLMRAIIKALLAKPCVIVALEAKANDPNLDEKREGFKFSLLPEAQHAGFETLYFNPLDVEESIHWNPLELSSITFASSIVQDINSLAAEEQHWAERDHGYIAGLAQLLKWGAIQVAAEDENGVVSEVLPLPCNPRGLMRLVNNRRNIVESLRKLKGNPEVDAAELTELTQTLSSIIRTDTEWDKNIQGVRGRLRMFKNPQILKVTEHSSIDLRAAMHKPTVLIFGAPASLGPDAESLSSCFVYQLQQALHTRYGTASVLPLFAFFDEYQTLNMDIAGRLSAIVRGANGGLTIILQNISQIAGGGSTSAASMGASELKTIFSNSAVRVCLHNADETTARFFSEEIGKHAVVVPGIADHFDAGAGIFPSSWNRIHSQQVVARVDPDSIKRMEKQHALVYLSPAGDLEFGETKPFMVDLRGIEEIARLHLLHNVASRTVPPAAPDMAEISPDGDFENVSGEIVYPDIATTDLVAPERNMASLVRPFPRSSMPAPAEEQPTPVYPANVGNTANYQNAQPVGPSWGNSARQAANPAFPSTDPFAQASSDAARNNSSVQSSSQLNPASAKIAAERLCGKCGHLAGGGKFCIQCGTFIGAVTNPPAAEAAASNDFSRNAASGHAVGANVAAEQPDQAPFPAVRPSTTSVQSVADQITASANSITQQPANPPVAPESKTNAMPKSFAEQAFGSVRKPLKSLSPDLSQLGITQQSAPSRQILDNVISERQAQNQNVEF
jgi:type IV secretory pathway TraG/TraD family ATPase VirD4